MHIQTTILASAAENKMALVLYLHRKKLLRFFSSYLEDAIVFSDVQNFIQRLRIGFN